MKRFLSRFFFPHADNGHVPHVFSTAGVVAVLAVLILFVMGAAVGRLALRGSDFLAAVLPSVLTDLANVDRVPKRLATLTVSPVLTAAAKMKAEDMAKNSYFAHVSPSGVTPWYWFEQAGYRFAAAGENLAVHFDDSSAVNDAWMESPSHKANIMNGTFTEIGVATAHGAFEGQDTLFVVQLFGKPLPAASRVTAATRKTVSPAPAVPAESAKVPAGTPSLVSDANVKSIPPATLGASITNDTDTTIIRPASTFNRLATSPSGVSTTMLRMLALLIALPLIATAWRHLPHGRFAHVAVGILLLLSVVGVAMLLKSAASSSVVTTSSAAVIFSDLSYEGN